jgi:uncharacterized protein
MQGILSLFFKFKVVDGTRLGRACVALNLIKKGEIICKMTGPKIDLKHFFEKYEINDCTPLQISESDYIDLIEPYVCFNHSCNPNAGLRNNGVLFALRDIKEGEEIMYDYSTTVDDIIWKMDCLCKQPGCRKVIGDFQSIPHQQKEFYLKNNALTEYIKKTYY